jgi:HK97 family phage major capsid protein
MSETDKNKKSWTPDQLVAKIKEVCGVVVAERLETLQKTVTDHGQWISGASSHGNPRISLATTNDMKGLLTGGIVTSLALARGNAKDALDNEKKRYNTDKSEHQASIIKALESSTGTAGGFLIPEEYSSDFIDLLTPRAVVRSFGTTVLPMSSGSMIVPKLTAASSAYYIGESQQPTKSQPSFGIKRLNARKLGVLVPLSNDLIRRGGPRVATVVRNDALRSASLKEDVSFIRAQGTDYTPKGLRYQAAAANILTSTGGGTYDLDSVTTDLGRMVLALEEANVAFSNPGWIFSPRIAMFLFTLRDGLGNYVFRAEMSTGKFWGYPFKKTTQIPTNLGDGSDSEIYLADFDDVIIGDTLQIQVAVSEEATYVNENNETVSAFALDQTVMRLLMEHDIVLRHDESVAVMTAPWAPGGAS